MSSMVQKLGPRVVVVLPLERDWAFERAIGSWSVCSAGFCSPVPTKRVSLHLQWACLGPPIVNGLWISYAVLLIECRRCRCEHHVESGVLIITMIAKQKLLGKQV